MQSDGTLDRETLSVWTDWLIDQGYGVELLREEIDYLASDGETDQARADWEREGDLRDLYGGLWLLPLGDLDDLDDEYWERRAQEELAHEWDEARGGYGGDGFGDGNNDRWSGCGVGCGGWQLGGDGTGGGEWGVHDPGDGCSDLGWGRTLPG